MSSALSECAVGLKPHIRRICYFFRPEKRPTKTQYLQGGGCNPLAHVSVQNCLPRCQPGPARPDSPPEAQRRTSTPQENKKIQLTVPPLSLVCEMAASYNTKSGRSSTANILEVSSGMYRNCLPSTVYQVCPMYKPILSKKITRMGNNPPKNVAKISL